MGDLQHLLLALCSQDEVAELVEGMDFSRRLQFMLQEKNAVNEAKDRCVRTFDA